MAVLKHDVDPQGDLLVILRESNSTNLIPKVSIVQPVGILGKQAYQEDTEVLNLPKVRSMLPADDGSGKRLFTTRNIVNSQQASGEEVVEVHFKVSSQHMELASPVFRRMLNGPWSESTFPESPSTPTPAAGSVSPKPPSDIPKDSSATSTIEDSSPSRATSTSSSSPLPTRQVNAHGWRPEALLLVLNIIHGMNDEFPLVTGVEFLAEVAAIVDYYQCQRAVKLAGEVWYQTVYRLPRTYGKRCILWLFIAWAFGWKDDFSKLASFVIEHGEGLDLIKSNSFPITAILGQY
ncbi:hypothetical protein LB503_000182 [Fusarium chuoi]|nr:hypothetical protein LB503_000182 [Fusarium chuoi]